MVVVSSSENVPRSFPRDEHLELLFDGVEYIFGGEAGLLDVVNETWQEMALG